MKKYIVEFLGTLFLMFIILYTGNYLATTAGPMANNLQDYAYGGLYDTYKLIKLRNNINSYDNESLWYGPPNPKIVSEIQKTGVFNSNYMAGTYVYKGNDFYYNEMLDPYNKYQFKSLKDNLLDKYPNEKPSIEYINMFMEIFNIENIISSNDIFNFIEIIRDIKPSLFKNIMSEYNLNKIGRNNESKNLLKYIFRDIIRFSNTPHTTVDLPDFDSKIRIMEDLRYLVNTFYEYKIAIVPGDIFNILNRLKHIK